MLMLFSSIEVYNIMAHDFKFEKHIPKFSFNIQKVL